MPNRRVFVQSRLADLREGEPRLLPAPRSALLEDPSGGVHEIDPSVVSELGLHVESGYCLARGTDGRPHLWLRRRRVPRALGTGSRLAFDPLTADFDGRPTTASTSFRVELSTGDTTLRDGVARTDATLTVTNEGSTQLDRLIVYFDAQSGELDPPLHTPVIVGPIAPSSTLSTTIEVRILQDPSSPEPFVLRGLVIELDRPGALAKLATAPLDLAPADPSPHVPVERTGAISADIDAAESAASVLDLRFELRDARRIATSLEALGVLTLTNASEEDIDDLDLVFEHGIPEEASWRWTPVPFRHRDALRGLRAESSLATPILLTLPVFDPPILFLRVRALSRSTGLVRLVRLVQRLP